MSIPESSSVPASPCRFTPAAGTDGLTHAVMPVFLSFPRRPRVRHISLPSDGNTQMLIIF
jgi:hypothetical protein